MVTFYISRIDSDYQSERFVRFYNSYRNKMMAAAYSILKNHHDAEEAVQNALFAIAKNVSLMPDPSTKHAENYAVKAAKNHAINIAKRRRVFVELSDAAEPSCEDLLDKLERRDELRTAVKALAEMKPLYRDVLSARIVFGLNVKEISELYGLPASTVKTRINRGMKILKEAFERSDDDV